LNYYLDKDFYHPFNVKYFSLKARVLKMFMENIRNIFQIGGKIVQHVPNQDCFPFGESMGMSLTQKERGSELDWRNNGFGSLNRVNWGLPN
jgi:hypothetical protein